MEKKKGLLYCCCKEAERNCYLTCPKARRLKPDRIYIINEWEKKVRGK